MNPTYIEVFNEVKKIIRGLFSSKERNKWSFSPFETLLGGGLDLKIFC
jgi:hypothetical protein